MFELKKYPKLSVGEGSIQQVFAGLTHHKRILIVANQRLQNSAEFDQIKLFFKGAEVFMLSGILPNPTLEKVDEGASLVRANDCTLVVGIGGGSVMDSAKCIAALKSNEGSARDYFYGNKALKNKGAETVCVPTTSGTASEVTGVSVFSDGRTKKTMMSPYLYADYAVVEPKLTYTMPPALVAETGWDAFCHALESYWSIRSNPVTRALALEAVNLIWHNIEGAYKKNHEAMDQMATASVMAGLAFSQTRTSVLHAISYDLTAWYGLAHGRACAVNLLPFVRYCYPAAAHDLDKMFRCLDAGGLESFLSTLKSKLEGTGIDTRLRDCGMPKGDIEALAESVDLRDTTHYIRQGIDRKKLTEILRTYY